MQDILQIVVQAEDETSKISPSCLLVHQNGGSYSKDQNMEGRRRFEEKLIKTVIAAEEEQCSDNLL